jgi:hypothetical protein
MPRVVCFEYAFGTRAKTRCLCQSKNAETILIAYFRVDSLCQKIQQVRVVQSKCLVFRLYGRCVFLERRIAEVLSLLKKSLKGSHHQSFGMILEVAGCEVY